MMKGEGSPPTHETLTRIMRIENVSVSWLLGADCPPFIVRRTVDDLDTANAVRAHLDDSDDWNVSVLSSGDMCAIVLHQPAEIGSDDQPTRYTAIEVIAGPFGALTAVAIRQRRSPDQIETHRIDAATMREIYAGRLGTFALLGDGNTPGVIVPGQPRNECPDLMDLIASPTSRVAEPHHPYNIADQLREAWPLMQEGEQETLGRMLAPLIEDVEKRRSGNQPKPTVAIARGPARGSGRG
jgi:hypothetical protein